jgi:hypothetical protein
MKKIILTGIIVLHSTVFPLATAEMEVLWPLHKVNVIKSESSGWNDKFYIYSESRLSAYHIQGKKTIVKELQTLSIIPQLARHFPLVDVEAIVVWSNVLKKMEILIFDKNDKLLSKETLNLADQVDDLKIRFGQGRRPALLFIKNNKDEHKASLWFDAREQVIFLQGAQIIADTLDWVKLSAYIVTREGSKPVIKLWKKGLVSVFELPFLPIYARFVDINDRVYLLAIDGKSALWSIYVENLHVIVNKILVMKELPFVKQIDVLSINNNPALVMHSPLNKKMFVLKSVNFNVNNAALNVETYFLADSDSVIPGKISGKLAWLESNLAQYTYLVNTENKYLPIVDLSWKVQTKDGYPEIFFTWGSQPPNKKFEYRYIIDNSPDSLPLPEYRVNENKLGMKLVSQGDYFLHIQARDPADGSESVVYHFPVFWKYRPAQPNISLINEVTPYVVTGNNVIFMINNIEPLEYFAEINNIPVYDPEKQINTGSGEVQINQQLKSGRYYLHIRSRDPKTDNYSSTLHYLFFYQTYVMEFTVGATEYNRDTGKLNSLINQYKNAQSIDEKEKILKELELFKKNIEDEIKK